MKHIAFIINPISGAKRLQQVKRQLPELVNQILDHEQWQPTLVYTTHAGHATELAQQFAHDGFDAVVSVGGDGTVNEVARGLRDTTTALGILPMGSGNGLARHLHIPMDRTIAERLTSTTGWLTNNSSYAPAEQAWTPKWLTGLRIAHSADS